MTQTKILDGVKLESIFHPSDSSEASEVAFVHALKIALVAGAKLTMLHVEASPSAEWQDFPGVRDTLERWGAHPERQPQERGWAARHKGRKSSQVEQ
jgi:nucleotide-binding universal stress UspA family protein